MSTQAGIPVQLYLDYICPFCYVADARLQRLAGRYPLAVRYRFVEIHPDNPPEGRPLSELGYPAEQWRQMTAALERMVREDALPLAERTFTTNSRKAILLAIAVREERPADFPGLHRALFHAYFAERRNIGLESVLRELAEAHGVGDVCDRAWGEQRYLERFLDDVEAARRVGLTGVPTLAVGPRAFSGAVSVDTLEEALRREGVEPLEPD